MVALFAFGSSESTFYTKVLYLNLCLHCIPIYVHSYYSMVIMFTFPIMPTFYTKVVDLYFIPKCVQS